LPEVVAGKILPKMAGKGCQRWLEEAARKLLWKVVKEWSEIEVNQNKPAESSQKWFATRGEPS
jgi:hypothetical protein